ncbi:MAG: hypothetical protein NUV55_04825 [Sulfuricaulis sp.]|nr:hypothetical protein [Sulfuricaulis sp.]
MHRAIVRDPVRFLQLGSRLLIDESGPESGTVRMLVDTVFGTSAVVCLQYSGFTPAVVVEGRVEWRAPPEGQAVIAYEYETEKLWVH